MGRGTEYYDMPVVRRIVKDSEASQYRFSDVLLNIVLSEPFQMRVKEVPDAAQATASIQ